MSSEAPEANLANRPLVNSRFNSAGHVCAHLVAHADALGVKAGNPRGAEWWFLHNRSLPKELPMTEKEKFEALQVQIDALKAMHELLTISIAGLLPYLGQRQARSFVDLHLKAAAHWGSSSKPSEVVAASMLAPLLIQLQPLSELLHNARQALDETDALLARVQSPPKTCDSPAAASKPRRAPAKRKPPAPGAA
jgi:hypothetical protein